MSRLQLSLNPSLFIQLGVLSAQSPAYNDIRMIMQQGDIRMKIDGVFSGGGVKAYALLGALESIQEHDLTFERVAGTSAGAIVASLLAANYQIKDIQNIMRDVNLHQFLDPPKLSQILPFTKWFFLYFKLGLNKGDAFEKWLYKLLAYKHVYTFKDLKPGYLKVIVSDLTLGKLIVIPDDLERVYGINPDYFPVAKAVRMSAGFPYFFMPKQMLNKNETKSIIVDGGLLSNFPIWVFDEKDKVQKRPILGIKLSDSPDAEQPRDIHNAFDMFHALFSTMKQAHDARHVSTSKEKNIIFIPVKHLGAVDFNISQEQKDELFEKGRARADEFLKHWPT